MSELNVIKDNYERIVMEDFPHLGGIGEDELRIKAGEVRGCQGSTQNLLFYSLQVEDGRIRGPKYECQYCGATMYVVAELVGKLLEDRPVDELDAITDDEMAEALGGPSRKVIREARTAIRLIDEALNEIRNEH
jgi:hypothetical protein